MIIQIHYFMVMLKQIEPVFRDVLALLNQLLAATRQAYVLINVQAAPNLVTLVMYIEGVCRNAQACPVDTLTLF